MARSVIGIDINQSELRMVQLGSRTVMAVKRLPEGLVDGGHISAPEMLSGIIRDMKKEYHFSGKKCSLILPEGSCYFRSFTSPPVSADQLKMNLPYEFRDYLGSDSLAYVYDYAVEAVHNNEDGTPDTFELLAAATHRESLEDYAAVLSKAHLRLSIAIPREMALIRLLRQVQPEEGRARALVEFGYDRSRVFIYNGTRLMASKVIDIGCVHIDQAIAYKLSIDIYLAASYRETDHEGILADPVCQEVYRQLALEIMKTFNFFVYENPQIEFDDVCFAGRTELTLLRETVLDYIHFTEHNISELLPDSCVGVEGAGECLIAAGLCVEGGNKREK